MPDGTDTTNSSAIGANPVPAPPPVNIDTLARMFTDLETLMSRLITGAHEAAAPVGPAQSLAAAAAHVIPGPTGASSSNLLVV
jgi:hypothetical protein